MKELTNSVKLLVEDELTSANKKFGMFNSTHEGYAIIMEEVEELDYELGRIKYLLSNLWSTIKNNEKQGSLLERLRINATNAAAESIQIAAMAQKFIDSSNKW